VLSRNNRVSAALLIAVTLYGFAHFSDLPNLVAIHFDWSGKPNGYANRWVLLLFIPLLTLALTFFQSWLIRFSPEGPRQERARRLIPRLNLIMTAVMCAAQLAILSVNLPK
jgi:uncharacterized membrane protein